MTRSQALPQVALATTLVLWASAFVGIRFLAGHFAPGSLSLGRLLVGAVALWLTLAARRSWVRPTRKQWLGMSVIGVLWFGIYNLALNAGERLIDAGTAATLLQISPILIAVLSAVALGEHLSRWLLIGMGLAFAGVLVIGAAQAEQARANLWGIALCLLAALVYSISLIVQKRLVGSITALEVTTVACTVGAVVCLPFAGQLLDQARQAPVSALGALVYLGVFPTAIAFTTYAYALKYVEASQLGVSTYLVPPITAIISLVALNEAPPVITWIGGAMCLAGVALTRRRTV